MQLVEEAEKWFAKLPELSPSAVAVYFEPFRWQLTRSGSAAFRRFPEMLCRIDPAKTVAETTLRDYFAEDLKELHRALCEIAERVHAVEVRWNDRAVFDVFCKARQHDLYRYMCKKAGGNGQAAEDVTQETWLALWKWEGKRRCKGSLIAVAMKAGQHKVSDHYQRQRRYWLVFAVFSDPEKLQALIDRLPGPQPDLDEPRKRLLWHRLQIKLARYLFDGQSMPHQVLVFILGKILAYRPRRIVAEFADLTLEQITRRARRELIKRKWLTPRKVRFLFRGFQQQLRQPAYTVLSGDKRLRRYQRLLRARIGHTRLGDYFQSQDPREQAVEVSRWQVTIIKHLLTRATGECPEIIDELMGE